MASNITLTAGESFKSSLRFVGGILSFILH